MLIIVNIILTLKAGRKMNEIIEILGTTTNLYIFDTTRKYKSKSVF